MTIGADEIPGEKLPKLDEPRGGPAVKPANGHGVEMKKPAAGRPGAKRRLALRIGLIVLVLAILIGIPYYFYSRQFEVTDDAFLDAHTVEVSPRVAGHVVEVLVEDNAVVKKGQALVKLDPADFQTQVDQAKAKLLAAQSAAVEMKTNVTLTQKTTLASQEEAKAGIDVANAGVETASAAIDQAKAQETADEANDLKSRQDLERYKNLLKTGDITQQQFDQSQADATTADAKLAASKQAIVSAQAQWNEAKQKVIQAQSQFNAMNVVQERTDVSQQEYQSATEQIKDLQAALDQMNLNLDYTTIFAPFDGRVTLRQVEVGSYVQVGQALMALVPNDLFITANFKETQLELMRPGQEVTVTVDAFPGQEFKAKVDSMQRGSGSRFSLLPPENATGNYVKVVQRVPVKIVFDEPLPADRDFAIGMSVEPSVRVRDGWFQ